ncbi:MAG TPA: hypothetical protein VN917_03900 [Xanthobacteraceae bacterium]|nr:hypothetical protein [Xanthobacteraceae bacterium]
MASKPIVTGGSKKAVAKAASAQQAPEFNPEELLLAIAAGSQLDVRDVAASQVPNETNEALKVELERAQVSYDDSSIDFRRLSFVDEDRSAHELYLAQVAEDETESFRGSYLFEGGELIAKHEWASS